MDKFKVFLLNEEKNYLGRKVSGVLTPMQELQDDMPNMGARHLTRVAEKLVNDIRKILHGHWEQQQQHHLKELQKIAVAIQKTIEDKGDLREIIPSATQALQTLSGKLGVKVNNLQGPEVESGEPVSQNDFEETGDGPQQPQPGQPGQPQPPMPGQPPQPGQPPMPGQPML
jgi:hypothetical protein